MIFGWGFPWALPKAALSMAVGQLWGEGRPRPRAAPWAIGKRPFRPESQTYARHKPKTHRNGLVA
jgi:hypothetical protein